ncbi:MAG: XRE family transcriptional regulator [Nitrospirota bacterium]|jgi:predicted XRE-type DNA-binding protein|nr:XRE family transcriptional regulator [Nitrospirota bacterium]
MATTKTQKNVTVRTAEELGRALGLSMADTAEIEFRSELTVALAKIIQAGRLTHADIAKGAGTSRTRVTAIANGNTHGVSTDVLIRVLAATGYRAEVRVKKAAA